MYISSADLMTRNMQRRVELACPVYDPEIRRQINHVLELAWRDDVKARVLTKDGTYYKKSEGTVPLNSQQALIEEAALAERRAMKLPGGGAARPLAWVQNALARLVGRRV